MRKPPIYSRRQKEACIWSIKASKYCKKRASYIIMLLLMISIACELLLAKFIKKGFWCREVVTAVTVALNLIALLALIGE